jgi:uncharacterized membrane protein YdbT with pleckstrin-like domain
MENRVVDGSEPKPGEKMVAPDGDELLEGEQIYHLDPAIRIYWSAGAIAAGFAGWILLMIIGGLTLDKVLGIDKGFFPILFFTVVVLILLPYLLWVELNYHNYTYQFRKKRLVIRKGVLNKERVIIPYDRIQNINVTHNVMQRALRLATVKIETAGTNPWESEGVIEGVGNYQQFIKHTMELVEKTKEHEGQARVDDKTSQDEKLHKETELEYLKQIAAELKELKMLLTTRSIPDKPVAMPPGLKDEIDRIMKEKEKKKKR